MSFVDEMNALRSAEVITEEFVMNEARKIVSAAVDAHLAKIQDEIRDKVREQPLNTRITGRVSFDFCIEEKGRLKCHKYAFVEDPISFSKDVELPKKENGYQVGEIKSEEIKLRVYNMSNGESSVVIKVVPHTISRISKKGFFGETESTVGFDDLARQFFRELQEKGNLCGIRISFTSGYDLNLTRASRKKKSDMFYSRGPVAPRQNFLYIYYEYN